MQFSIKQFIASLIISLLIIFLVGFFLGKSIQQNIDKSVIIKAYESGSSELMIIDSNVIERIIKCKFIR
ncbi:MAG: hypothetical protein WA057_05235 [Candidatus Magasanikiibacteriota bacterium]